MDTQTVTPTQARIRADFARWWDTVGRDLFHASQISPESLAMLAYLQGASDSIDRRWPRA